MICLVQVHPSTKTGEREVNAMGGKFARRVYEKSPHRKKDDFLFCHLDIDTYFDEDNKKQATINAVHSKRPATISYVCNEDLKVYSYGVSAIDNDDAYQSYVDMDNAFGKWNAY